MSDHLTGTTFQTRSVEQLAKPFQRQAIPNAVDPTVAGLHRLFAGSDRDRLRDLGRDIRGHAVANLPKLVAQLVDQLETNGVTVHFAGDAAEARAIVVSICSRAGARRVVKAKSMLTEEIELNPALEAAGLEVVETDLGEYVVQLDGDRPSHIIGPIIHRTAAEVRELFSRVAGTELAEDAGELARFARGQLRAAFLAADVGISGANFAVAETGSIALVTNEGNGRLTTALPRVHIAMVGVERVVPRLDDLAVLVPLLTGSGTAQRITTYLTLASGPRREGEVDGPEEMHVVLVDGGRSAIVGSDYQEVLSCIRCGACQNICPVYRQVGGHAYGWVYGGPIGAVLTPLFRPEAEAQELGQASSLCGACDDICPVRIPLHDLLRTLRRDRSAGATVSRGERLAFRIWSYAWASPTVFRLSALLAPLAARVPIGPARRFTALRDVVFSRGRR